MRLTSALCLLLIFTIGLIWVYLKVFKVYSQNINLKMINDNLEAKVQDGEITKRTDFVTGIPNNRQFSEDLQRLSGLKADTKFQLIFIDIVDFGRLNKEYGYPTADFIIKLFAQHVYEGMRRNETMYKFPIKEMNRANDLWRRAYRKYNGGDEFMILLGGDEADAVGFCVRLQRDVISKLNPRIQFDIIKDTKWKIKLTIGIVPVFVGESEADVIARAHEAMRVVTQPGSAQAIAWKSGKTEDDWPDGSWQHKVYKDARELFRC